MTDTSWPRGVVGDREMGGERERERERGEEIGMDTHFSKHLTLFPGIYIELSSPKFSYQVSMFIYQICLCKLKDK